MHTHHNEATENQLVILTPRTAEAIAEILGLFSKRMNLPHIACDPQHIEEVNIRWIAALVVILASEPEPSEEVSGLS